MKKCRGLLFALAALCILFNSCKLDVPVLPGDPGYVETNNVVSPGVVTGTTINGTTVNNSNLPAIWKAAVTVKRLYDQNNSVVASSAANNLFASVLLDEQTKTAGFEGLTTAIPSVETYTLSSSDGNLYIQLSADPFSRSVNARIQITNLTTNSMTWLVIDPLIITAGGQLLRNAYQVTFTK